MIDVSSTNNDDRLQHMQPDTNIISPELLYSRGVEPDPRNKMKNKGAAMAGAVRALLPNLMTGIGADLSDFGYEADEANLAGLLAMYLAHKNPNLVTGPHLDIDIISDEIAAVLRQMQLVRNVLKGLLNHGRLPQSITDIIRLKRAEIFDAPLATGELPSSEEVILNRLLIY